MGDIISIKNFNRYCGRYSRKSNSKTPEKEIGWYIYDSLLEKIPILALRKKNEIEEGPLLWERGKNLNLALDLTLRSLKAWQAFRPLKYENIENEIKKNIPREIYSFQKMMDKSELSKIRDATKLEQDEYDKIVIKMSKIVGYLSSYKNNHAPMLGSKIMHFLFPESFPVWDTAWIKNTAIAYEDTSRETLKSWFSAKVEKKLEKDEYGPSSIKYAKYIALMLKDLSETNHRDYQNIVNAYIKYSEVPRKVVTWHFPDLAPILYEVCLLGKHNA